MIGWSENQLGCKVIDTVGVFECDRYVKSTGSEAFRTKRVIILPVFKHSVSEKHFVQSSGLILHLYGSESDPLSSLFFLLVSRGPTVSLCESEASIKCLWRFFNVCSVWFPAGGFH